MNSEYRNRIMHDTGESSYTGEFKLTKEALKNYNIEAKNFGSTEILLENSKSFRVKDYQYLLNGNTVGMHFIPVNDYGSIPTADKKLANGFEILDNFVRTHQKLKDGDQIYTYLTYFHPEQNKGTIIDLAKKTDKAEMGMTHIGSYLGKGYTTNAPQLYHTHKFGIDGSIDNTPFGYPANVQYASLEGEDQATINKTLLYVDTILNNDVQFPVDYKCAVFRPADINTAFMFYKDWLEMKSYLWNDETWYTYCAAHKTLVTTIAFNLPHNEKSFQQVYGEKKGARLFKLFKKRYSNIIGPCPGFQDCDQTFFQPLWEKEKLTQDQIKPFHRIQYATYDFARRHKLLPIYPFRQPLKPTTATPWAPQQAIDILYDFVQTYADFIDAGAVSSCQIILGFMPIVEQAVGISTLGYLKYAMPILRKTMYADAQVSAKIEKETYLEERFKELFKAFGGKLEEKTDISTQIKAMGKKTNLKDILKDDLTPAIIATWSLLTVIENWENLMNSNPLTTEQAYEQLMESIQSDIEKARRYEGKSRHDIEFFTPPAIIHMISVGMFESNKFVKIHEICTIIDTKELEIK
ncbi:MAG: hypothetical protein JXR63_12365 [Spirochaetales bacterium]|nr:hypothetical protein [Spirochaetales bacterium]